MVLASHTSNNTVAIACLLARMVVTAGPDRSAQRNLGACLQPIAEVLSFVGVDMRCNQGVVDAAMATIDGPDEDLGAGEDWDLSPGTPPLARAGGLTKYGEGRGRYACRSKARYAKGLRRHAPACRRPGVA